MLKRIKKNQFVRADIRTLSKKVAKLYRPEKIILFGSYAWGTPKRDSDVDLLVVKKTVNTRKCARDIDRALFPRTFPIDVFVYTPSQVKSRLSQGDPFLEDIVLNGTVLYGRKNGAS